MTKVRNYDAAYRNTIYHCAGVPFTKGFTYDELNWTARSYHCLVDHFPVDVKLYDAHDYKQRFSYRLKNYF